MKAGLQKSGSACRALIEHFEGRRLQAYPDPGPTGLPVTIGVGHTGPEVHLGLVWTDEQVGAALQDDITNAEYHADRALLGRLVTQWQYDALVSIMLNVGPGRPDVRLPGRAGIQAGRDGILILRTGAPSTLVRKLLVGDISGAADQFLLWDKAGGKSLRGLRRRRAAERALFLGHSAEEAIAIGAAAQ